MSVFLFKKVAEVALPSIYTKILEPNANNQSKTRQNGGQLFSNLAKQSYVS